MGKKKEKENLAEEMAKSFERWEYLMEHGGSDPFFLHALHRPFSTQYIGTRRGVLP